MISTWCIPKNNLLVCVYRACRQNSTHSCWQFSVRSLVSFTFQSLLTRGTVPFTFGEEIGLTLEPSYIQLTVRVSLLSTYRRGLSAFSNRIRARRDRVRELVTGMVQEKSCAELWTRRLPAAVRIWRKMKLATTITFITTTPRASWVPTTTITTITTISIQTPYYISASRATTDLYIG